MSQFEFNAVGTVESPYKQKFAIPRQPGLVPAAKGRIKLTADYNHPDVFKGLEKSSHLWVLFVFHQTMDQGWKPLVRPPRLGGNEKRGVFATRSTFRPNPIGMSVVRNEGVIKQGKQLYLQISELDLLDGTPVLDIKPYLPYSDALPLTTWEFIPSPPDQLMGVTFSPSASEQLDTLGAHYADLAIFIRQVLQQDPRPGYKKSKQDEKRYVMNLYDLNISWRVDDNCNHVLEITHHNTP